MVRGTLRMHPRGFGFLEHETGTLFVPPPVARGFVDGDIVDGYSPDGDACETMAFIERGRQRLVGDVRDGTFVVDEAIANRVVLTLPRGIDTAAMEGHTVWYDLEDEALIEDLGDALSERALEVRMYERHLLPMGHGEEAEAEAAAIDKIESFQNPLRRDHREKVVITIDAEHSRDLDDALSAQMMPDGTVRVWVHIADVAEYITPGSAIDREARECPTSVYLPQKVRHMLPECLASTKLSLIPGEARDTLCVEMGITPEGVLRSVDVYEARIESRARLTYIEVGEMIASGARHDDSEIHDLVATLHVAASRLSVQRAARGGVDSWRTDEQAGMSDGESRAHTLIERLMVASNEAVAEWLESRGMGVLYRAHPGLTAEQTTELDELCREIGIMASSGQTATPKSFAALAHAAHEAGLDLPFWDAAMSVMPRAQYQAEPQGHFGLGSAGYCHFTSPLRRYADLLVHREVKAYLNGARTMDDHDMREMAPMINDTNRRASMCERDGERARALAELERGQTLDGQIIGKQKRWWKVQLVGNTTGLLPIPDDDHRKVGDTLRVRVRQVQPLLGNLDLSEDGREEGRHRGSRNASTNHRKHRIPSARR